ncbi:MAG: hypothetical protein M1838_000995 [Thelocarpon superellum]|nr:MAG: hypothetical protein M1838_000995 [Thelocarpon superellum]
MSVPSSAAPKQLRQPPPSLFAGPPSHNGSQVSLPIALPPNLNPSNLTSPVLALPRAPLFRNRSGRGTFGRSDERTEPGSVTSPLRSGPRQQLHDEGRKQADRADDLWAEMQRTLEGAELSAVRSTHVFGAEHSKALDGLRTAQIALAQAWARSEADDVTNPSDVEGEGEGEAAPAKADRETATVADGAPDSALKNTPAPAPAAEAGKEKRADQLEEETESDLLQARKRREANDRYFHRVNAGVLDVVAKLEDVAIAMRGVKHESRDIWNEDEESTSASTS